MPLNQGFGGTNNVINFSDYTITPIVNTTLNNVLFPVELDPLLQYETVGVNAGRFIAKAANYFLVNYTLVMNTSAGGAVGDNFITTSEIRIQKNGLAKSSKLVDRINTPVGERRFLSASVESIIFLNGSTDTISFYFNQTFAVAPSAATVISTTLHATIARI